MLSIPSFESSALVTDDPLLAAQISSLFRRPRHYFPVLNGPRMSRPDADNEAVRCRNALVMVRPRSLLLGRMLPEAISAVRPGWKNCTVADAYEDHVIALRGVVKRPVRALRWGTTNLGIGLYRARLEHKEFLPDLESSPDLNFIEAGTHLLIACERGDMLAEVLSCNLAFSCGASFAVLPELPVDHRDEWLEDLYALGEGADLSGRFNNLAQRARDYLGSLDCRRFKSVLFITGGFPWGISFPEVPTTHMYRYPDFGRAIIEGLWKSQSPDRSARTALLIDPGKVEGSEIQAINNALVRNGSLTRVARGPAATSTTIQFLFDLLPHDIIVLSSHAGDAPGERITYEYPDADGRKRRLTVETALGIGYDRHVDMFRVTEYHRFHSLDGVDWHDREGKAALPVGSAIKSWMSTGIMDRKQYVVNQESIPRVIGSMGIQLHDGIWLFTSHGFVPESAPLIINNSCWSWHELSKRTTFAGARAYVGSLFPITNAEAQEVGLALFGKYIGQELPKAVWLAQREVYGGSGRRPYVMVGLPFVSIRRNKIDSFKYMSEAYADAIVHWSDRAKNATHEEIRQNAKRFSDFLCKDMSAFRQGLVRRRR